MRALTFIALLAATPAAAQSPPPVQPQPGLHKLVSVEVRLKGAPTATGEQGSTVRLITFSPQNADSRTFILTQACWNKTAICPAVHAATVRLYLKLPWSTRLNVTRFVLCGSTECTLPHFAPIQAKPGQAYKFSYDRVEAIWTETPSVVVAP